MGIEKLIMKHNKLVGYFIKDQQSKFYQSAAFTRILQFVQQNAGICKMKEKQTRHGLRLLLTFDNVKSVTDALTLLKPVLA
jgi:transcription-repair coupling factor (superfamily II helicase)